MVEEPFLKKSSSQQKKKISFKKNILLRAASVDRAETAFFLPLPFGPINPPASVNVPNRKYTNLTNKMTHITNRNKQNKQLTAK